MVHQTNGVASDETEPTLQKFLGHSLLSAIDLRAAEEQINDRLHQGQPLTHRLPHSLLARQSRSTPLRGDLPVASDEIQRLRRHCSYQWHAAELQLRFHHRAHAQTDDSDHSHEEMAEKMDSG